MDMRPCSPNRHAPAASQAVGTYLADVLAASYAQTLEALWLIGQLPDGC